MEIERKIGWLRPERIMKLYKGQKSPFGINRMLIIGVGKNGIDCALQCKHLTEKRFGTDNKKVRFIGIAEDRLLSESDCEGSVFTEEESLPIVPEEAVYQYLNNPENLPPYAARWFDSGLKNYSPAAPTYGLSKRQCGRVALFHCMGDLLRLIGDAASAFEGDKSLEIVLTGNTGDAFFGGMFIDIAYIIRKLFQECPYHVRMTAYMFMPDTAMMFEKDQRELGQYFANAVIAKNELDLFQCKKKPFSQQYSGTFEVSSDKPPFDACFIAAAEDSYRLTLNRAAEKILNRMEVLFTKDDDAERIMSYNMLNKNGPHDFRYLSYGVRVAEVPVGKLTSYLCVKVYDRLKGSLSQNSVGEMQLGLYAAQVTPDARLLAQKAGELPELDYDENTNPIFSAKSLKSDNDEVQAYINSWLERVSESSKSGADSYMEEIAGNIISVCEGARNDLKKGPFYAVEIMRKCTMELRSAVDKARTEAEDYRENLERYHKLERDAYKKLRGSLSAAKQAEQYLYELKGYVDCRFKVSTADTLADFYQGLYDKFTDYLNNTLYRSVELFDGLSSQRSAMVEEIMRTESEESCSFDAFAISEEMLAKLDSMVDNVSLPLINKYYRESHILSLPDEETALASTLADIVCRCFGDLLSRPFSTLCEFFGVKGAVSDSIARCIDSVEAIATTSDSFALNRVICPKSIKQEDVATLRAMHKGMSYIWNGSVMNDCSAVSQIRGSVRLESFKGYDQWENMRYAYVNDSLKKHGLRIFN